MTELAIIIGLIFSLVSTITSLLYSIRQGRMTLLSWAFLAMGGIYGAGWIFVLSITKIGGNPEWERWILPFRYLYIIHSLCAFVLFFFTFVGWKIASHLFHPLQDDMGEGMGSINKRLMLAGFILLFFSVIAQWVYSSFYGGVINLLQYSIAIRSGVFEMPNPFGFLKPFGGLSFFSSFLFFGLLLNGYRNVFVKAGFALSLLFSIYIQMSWLGRMDFLVYLSTFFFSVLLFKRVGPITVFLGGGAMLCIVLIFAYYISSWVGMKANDNISYFIVREISFPFGSFFAQLDSGQHLFRGFQDFFYTPLYLLPSSWWSGDIENVAQINTAIIMGARKGELGVTGTIPVDLITLGIMQASIIGVCCVGFLFGAVLCLIQRLLDKVKHDGFRAVLEAYISLKIAIVAIFYSQPSQVVSTNFDLIVSITIILTILKFNKIKLSSKTY